MKIKTSDLIGPALDWAVAKCWFHDSHDSKRVRIVPRTTEGGSPQIRILNNPDVDNSMLVAYSQEWTPSTYWSQGGPIIEREGIGIYPSEARPNQWAARTLTSDHIYGPTPLIAAMRCYVSSKLGDEINIPEGLI